MVIRTVPLMMRVRLMSTPRMMVGALLSTAAINVFLKHRVFGYAGYGIFSCDAQSVRWAGRKGTDTCGAAEDPVMKLNAIGGVRCLSVDIVHNSRNIHANEADHCKASDMVMKRMASGVDVYGLSPVMGQSLRYFGGKRTGECKSNGDRVMKSEAAAEEVEEPLKVVDYLNSLRNFEKEGLPKGAGTESDVGFDLQRMSRLLLHLGDPLSKYPVVHVAGTKGKGSTVSFLSHILRAAGFRVGSYTSPHLKSLRERIVSGTTGQPISIQAFNQLFYDVQESVDEAVVAEAGALTHFEVLTALAFVHFARENVDMAVIEAGLGGARDATNVIQARGLLAAVITRIGEEHLDALGGSLQSIAHAKAGIIKHERPVIIGRQTESLAENVIRQVAASKKAVVSPPPGWNAVYNLKGICADSFNPHQICDILINQSALDDSMWMMKNLKIPALGSHQLDNAAAAIQTAMCLRTEGWEISDSAIRLGVENTTLPGRFQFATPAEAMELHSHGSTVILDGAHTVDSAAALASTLQETFPNECLAMVVAMAVDKDHKGFAKAILQGTKSKIIVTTKVDIAASHKRCTQPRALADSFMSAGQDLNIEVLTGNKSYAQTKSAITGISSIAPECTTGFIDPISGFNKLPTTTGIKVPERKRLVLVDVESIQLAIAKAVHLVEELNGKKPGVICITGSLHAVSATMSLLSNSK